MEYWIDIEDGSGNRLGDGPIVTATRWEYTPRLDEAGSFSFAMPASDPRSSLVQERRVARCRAVIDGEVVELGSGIIERIDIRTSARRGTTLQVHGRDLLAELAMRSVHDLQVCEKDWIFLTQELEADPPYWRGSVRQLWSVYSDTGDIDLPEAHNGNTTSGGEPIKMWREADVHAWWVYVGCDARFDRVYITMGDVVNDLETTLVGQYYNGHDWVDLPNMVDGTQAQDPGGWWCTFRKSGAITFDRPSDWTRYAPTAQAGSWFWVRFTVLSGQATREDITLREVEVYADVPTTNGLNLIMAYAPEGWQKSGYPPTTTPKYAEFRGESVLAALRTLVAQGDGEHFRLGEGRYIEWFDTWEDSGLRAVQGGVEAENNADICLIQDLQQRRDASELVTRVYPVSADGIPLALTTRSAPSGWTLSRTQGYLENDAGVLAHGVIEAVVRFTDVSTQQADSFYWHPSMTANALFDRALEWLRTRCVETHHYDLTVTKLPKVLRPGQTVDVVYHEYTDGYHVVDIDTVAEGKPLYLLAPTVRVDREGVHTVQLDVADVDREPTRDADVLVNTIQDTQRMAGAMGGVVARQVVTHAIGGEVTITGGTIDGVTIGAMFPGPATFTDVQVNGDIGVTGTVDGVDISAHAANEAAHHSPVTAGNGIAVVGQQVGVDLADPSGLAFESGKLALADTVAGNGLTISDKVLAVGQGAGLTVTADAVSLTTPGTLAHDSANSASGNHTHAVTASSDVGTSPTAALLKSTSEGGLTLGQLDVTGAATVGESLWAAESAFRVIHHTHDYDHCHVVVNPTAGWTLDEQFGLDVDDNLLVRGWIVGKHAIQLEGAKMICHYDGQGPYGTDFTGNPTGHMGQVATVSGGVIYRPGRFGKAVQVAQATTNLVTNPSFEVGLSGWIQEGNYGSAGTRSDAASYFGEYSLRVQRQTTGVEYQGRYTIVPVAEGQTYTVSAWGRLGSGNPNGYLWVRGAVPSTRVALGRNAEWERAVMTVTATSTGDMHVVVYSHSGTTGDTFYADGVQVEAKAYPTPYCDGSLGPGHAWTGTAHASTSTRDVANLQYATQSVPSDYGTIMAWVYRSIWPATSTEPAPRLYRNPSGGAWEVQLNAEYKITIWAGGIWSTTPPLEDYFSDDGEWMHIAHVWDDTYQYLYLNGVLVYTANRGTEAPGAGIYVGNRPDGARPLNGLIDDFVILDRALSADEVRAVYESNAPVFAETSTWHWRAGRNLVWADSEGLWMVDEDGEAAFAVSGTTKSWGGANLGAGDVFIGNLSQGHYLHWDDSEARLTVRGDLAIEGTVSVAWDDITNKPDGAGRLGTATQGGNPGSAGLWLTGYDMGYWNGSSWPVYIRSNGTFYFSKDGNNYVKYDGSTFEVKGRIVVTEGTTVDTLPEGTTYGKVRKTIISGGYIQVGSGTKDSTLNGWHIGADEIVGQKDGADQVVLDTDGVIKAGAGAIRLNAAGIEVVSAGDPPSAQTWFKFKHTDVTTYTNFFGFIATAKTDPDGHTWGTMEIGANHDANNQSFVQFFKSQFQFSILDGGVWGFPLQGTRTAVNVAAGLNVGVANAAESGSLRVSKGIGANISFHPGPGDICAGRYLRTDGDSLQGRVYFGTTCYLHRIGSDIYWWNGSTSVKLN